MSSLTPAVDDYVEGSVRKNRDIPDIPSQRLTQVLNSHSQMDSRRYIPISPHVQADMGEAKVQPNPAVSDLELCS